MALKYYLQLRPFRVDRFHWSFGKDPMHRKLNKMLGKQLPFFATGDCISIRRANFCSEKRRIISKGRFFQQWNVDFRRLKESIVINQQEPDRSKILFSNIFSDKRWKIRRHPRWIAPYLTTDEAELLDTKQVMEAPLERIDF